MTPLISTPTHSINHLKLVTCENACYAMQLCIAEYRSPHSVFQSALESTPLVPLNEALEKAKRYVNNQTISLDDSDDEDSDEGGNDSHLTFKLSCPISMSPMDVPVRGRMCRHFQCFDLFNFILSNSFPSGRRWKCPCCDNFVSLDSLEVCGLFKDMLEKHRKDVLSDGKDIVKIYSNGRWELMSPTLKKKLNAAPQQEVKRTKVVEEIILD